MRGADGDHVARAAPSAPPATPPAAAALTARVVQEESPPICEGRSGVWKEGEENRPAAARGPRLLPLLFREWDFEREREGSKSRESAALLFTTLPTRVLWTRAHLHTPTPRPAFERAPVSLPRRRGVALVAATTTLLRSPLFKRVCVFFTRCSPPAWRPRFSRHGQGKWRLATCVTRVVVQGREDGQCGCPAVFPRSWERAPARASRRCPSWPRTNRSPLPPPPPDYRHPGAADAAGAVDIR